MAWVYIVKHESRDIPKNGGYWGGGLNSYVEKLFPAGPFRSPRLLSVAMGELSIWY